MIVQEHPYGCGVAAVAEVLRITYREALVLFGPGAEHKAETFGFYLHELAAAMRAGGWRSYWVEVQPTMPAITMDDIVFINPNDQYPAGHYLAKRWTGWSNSWLNYPHIPRMAGPVKLVRGPAFVLFNTKPRA